MTWSRWRSSRVMDRSRASRIARGSGRKQKEVHDLVKRFDQMQALMSTLGRGGGLFSKVPGLGTPPGAAGLGGGVLDANPAALRGGSGGSSVRRMRPKDAASRKKNKRKETKKSRRKGRR